MGKQAHKCLGFDPGSSSWKIAVLDDRRVIWTGRIATERISKDPSIIRALVDQHGAGLQAIAAPSGFGLPVTSIDMVGDRELALMTLKRDGPNVVGLGQAIQTLKEVQKETAVKCFVLPSVKHLRTIPAWRKINRVDLGTTDKLCAAAHALQEMVERGFGSYDRISFVLGEVGNSFISMVCVKGGRVVDGIGGTNVGFGTAASGALDAELAHVWSFPDKPSLYSGGLVHVAGKSLDGIEESLSGVPSPRVKRALRRLTESLASDAVAMASRNKVKPFILSSALGPLISKRMERAVEGVGLEVMEGINDEMSASIGAAYLVNGLMGGRYRGLSESLAIREAKGSVLDQIFYAGGPALP